MPLLSGIAGILSTAIFLFQVVMWVRFGFDLLTAFVRDFRPRGAGLVIAEFVFTITDPPIRAVRRVIPPLRVGGVALDFAWVIVMLAASLLRNLLAVV